MEFKKIQLNGFKSFAEKTNFLIEEGLTGIVGPNGCGKSNIVESLRWVMGETSAKSMRGSGMEDVIFSGTSNKASKNIAEVSIEVENKEKEGPIQYRELENIQVRRKIEKDKGSNFILPLKILSLLLTALEKNLRFSSNNSYSKFILEIYVVISN